MSEKKNTNVVSRTLTSPAALGGAAGAGIAHRMAHKSRDPLHHSKWKGGAKGKRLLAGALLGAGGGYLVGHLRRLLASKSLIGRVRKAENEGKAPTHYLTGSEKNMYKELTKKAADERAFDTAADTAAARGRKSHRPGSGAARLMAETVAARNVKVRRGRGPILEAPMRASAAHLVGGKKRSLKNKESKRPLRVEKVDKPRISSPKSKKTKDVYMGPKMTTREAWDLARKEQGKHHLVDVTDAPTFTRETAKTEGAKMKKEYLAALKKGKAKADSSGSAAFRKREARVKKYHELMKKRDAEKERLKSPWWKFWS